MPPPTMSPQGSRSGLITAVVVLSILFVTSAIFAFYFSAENSKTAKSLTEVRKKANQFANDEAQVDPAISALAELRSDPKYQGQSAIQILMEQKNALAKQAASLTANVATLTDKLKAAEADNQAKTDALAAGTEKLTEEIAQRTAMQAELQAKFDEQDKNITEALANLETKRDENDERVNKIQSEVGRAQQALQTQISDATKEVANRDQKVSDLQAEVAKLKAKVVRPPNTAEAIIRQADGQVVRVPGNDNVFINLGTGDQISPGMTFEVYDRFGGIPGLGSATSGDNADDRTNLPEGKASIEVVNVRPGQSECRIIRQKRGTPVIEGDVIANLVYDKNTKYQFVVFGDFDLDQDGVATPGDGQVIKSRIAEWGGKLMNEVTVDSDFVVLGHEPEVPLQDVDETATDIARREAAARQLDAYNEVRSKAIELNIPIMNQNRFLYYVGYYEQAQR